ncbi:MAG: glutathione S-transferase family protein [Pseudomonadota bacterium]
MSTGSKLTKTELQALVDATNSYLTNAYTNKVIGPGSGKPRFELYHADLSLCSYKVRTVMAEKGATYFSHALHIMPAGKFVPHNYRPEYVRLRLQGAPDQKFVGGYTGASSVQSEGFDPCVVPTLVDHEEVKVVVDSRTICEHIDRAVGGTPLIPEGMEEVIDAQIRLVDEVPHVAALYGAHPDDDFRPIGLRKNIAGVHVKKIRALNAMIEQVKDDPALLEAYRAKISKEASAGAFVIDADGMRATHLKMAEHVDTLEAQLETHDGDWVCGDAFTMADIMWALSMYRLDWLGFGRLWADKSKRPRLIGYLDRVFARPSVRAGCIEWRGAHAPSPHVAEYSGAGAAANFFAHSARSLPLKEIFLGVPNVTLPPLEPLPPQASQKALSQ